MFDVVEKRALGAAVIVSLSFMPAAVSAGQVDALLQAMQFDDVVEVLAFEGREMSEELAEADFGIPEPLWDVMLGKLYNTQTMQAAFKAAFDEALEGVDVAPMITFFETDLGQRLTMLELEARKAISDEAVIDAAIDAWSEMPSASPRAVQIDTYIDANDLVEMNIVSSMNSDIAYLQGIGSVGAASGVSNDSDILAQIWASEPEVRAHVSEWIYGFSVLAYEPLSDDEFEAYIEFSSSKPGQSLNAAMFAAFDTVYSDLSYGLGAGTAQLVRSRGGSDL